MAGKETRSEVRGQIAEVKGESQNQVREGKRVNPTDFLPLMPFFPGCADHSTHMKALIEKGHCLPFSTLVSFFLANEEFDLTGKKAADGRLAPSGKNPGLAKQLSAETDRDVLPVIVS
jgi:hypothetical protein